MSPLRGYYIIMPPLQCTDSFFVRHFYHYVTAPRLLYNHAPPSVYRFVFCQTFLSLCHRSAAIISSCHPFSVQIRFLSDISIIMSPLRGYYIIMPPLQCTDSFFVRHFYHYVTAPRFGYRFLSKPFCEGHFRLFCFFRFLNHSLSRFGGRLHGLLPISRIYDGASFAQQWSARSYSPLL